MTMISSTVPEPVAILSPHHPVRSRFLSWLKRINQELCAQRTQAILRNLDNRTREDFGAASCDRDEAMANEAGGKTKGLPREAFSWTRFSK